MTYEDYRQIRSAIISAESQLEQWSPTDFAAEEAFHDLVAARRLFEDIIIKAGYDVAA